MKRFRILLYILVFFVALAAGTSFVVLNEAVAPLNLVAFELAERPVALWVVLAFAIGGVLGMLTSFGMVLRLRTALMRANRQLRNAQTNPVSGD